jgi:hypothetical protein
LRPEAAGTTERTRMLSVCEPYAYSVVCVLVSSSGNTRSKGTEASASSGAHVFVYVHATALGSSTTLPLFVSTYPVK